MDPVEHATAKYLAETYYKLSPDIIPPQIDLILKDLDQKKAGGIKPPENEPEVKPPEIPKISKPKKKKTSSPTSQIPPESAVQSSPMPEMTPEDISYLNEYSRFNTHPVICRVFNSAFGDLTDPGIDPKIANPEEKYLIARKTVFKDAIPRLFILQMYLPILSDRFRAKKQTISKAESHKMVTAIWKEVVEAMSPLASKLSFNEEDITPFVEKMTAEGIISNVQIEHYDNIDQFEQEVTPPAPKSPPVPFQQLVDAKIEELRDELPIYDPDIEAKLTEHVNKIFQRLNTAYLKVMAERNSKNDLS